MLGQHMFLRLHTRTEWDNLLCCGESTVMGTGTPTVTTSGLSAANALLRKLGREPFVWHRDMKNYVRQVERPFTPDRLYETNAPGEKQAMAEALRCRFCEHLSCARPEVTDIRGIMRRTAVGNFTGAKKCWLKSPAEPAALEQYEKHCVHALEGGKAVATSKIVAFITDRSF